MTEIAPLVPADADLRDFQYMPLDVVRLRDCDLVTVASDAAFRCAVLLWCAAWHQVPASSLPEDDRLLAKLAGYGRDVKGWLAIRDEALHGFIKCSDGRLYHPVIAEKALEAIAKCKRGTARTARATAARNEQRNEQRNDSHDDNVTNNVTLNVTESKGIEGKGIEGKGKEREERKKDAAPSAAALDLKPPDPEADLFRRGKEVCGKSSGGLIKQVLQAKKGNIPLARAAIEQASTKASPREYLGAIVRGSSDEHALRQPYWDPAL